MLSEFLGTAPSAAGQTAGFGITDAWEEDDQSSQVTDHTVWKRKKILISIFPHKVCIFN